MFISITMDEIAPSWRGDFIAEIVAVVHHRAAGKVQIAFPQMSAGEKPTLGAEMRLFGDKSDLMALYKHDDFLAIDGAIRRIGGIISPPQAIPATNEYRVYYRDRRADHATPSRDRRQVRRGGQARSMREQNPDGLPYVRLIGFSTGKRWVSVFIREERVEAHTSHGVGSYGFSTTQRQTAVPHF